MKTTSAKTERLYLNYKKAFILSTILSMLLLLFHFNGFRIRIKYLAASLMGMQIPQTIPFINRDLLLSEFQPDSSFVSLDNRKNKYPSYPLIESHGHLGKYFKTSPEEISRLLARYKISYFVSLNMLTGKEFLDFKNEYNIPGVIHLSTLNFKRLAEKNGFRLMQQDLEQDIRNGSRGIKLWKNFGITEKLPDGSRLKMNDPGLDQVFDTIAQNKLPVFIHTGDPPAFFRKIDEHNERFEELQRRPEWSFHADEFPDFDELMRERDDLFSRHRDIQFVAVHFGEYPHDLKKAQQLLDNHPNVWLDIAARIDELGRHPYSTKNFIIKNQNRILFGMDGPPNPGKLEIYSRFLETEDEYFDYSHSGKKRKGLWKIHGLGLPKPVLRKLYHENAKRLLHL